MQDKDDDNFTKQMRKATKEIHAVSDALVNAKLAFVLSDDKVWADGLLVFFEVFQFLEHAMVKFKNTEVGKLRIEGLDRTEAFKKDLDFYLGKGWSRNYKIRQPVIKYLLRLKELEDKDPLMLMAYIYHLYMGLLSGGIMLKKKRQLVQKINPWQNPATIEGYSVTEFGEYNIYNLKKELRDRMNNIAKGLNEETKNKLLEESKTVFVLNNEIIRSVRGAGIVIVRQLGYFFLASLFTLLIIILFRYIMK